MSPPVDLVGRVAALLRGIAASEPTGVRTTDAARAAGIPRPTAHRLLSAMTKEGLVDRSSDGRWTMGPELFLLGLGAAPRYDVCNMAQPILRHLAVTTGESASFSVRRGQETVCLVHEEGTFPLRSHVLHEGSRFPLGVASAGLAVLAFMAEDERKAYLRNVGLEEQWGPQHSAAAIADRLKGTRQTGFSLNPGLIVEGSWGMGAAVFGHDERVTGAVSLTGVENRFSIERQRALGAQLMAAALELSKRVQRQAAGEHR